MAAGEKNNNEDLGKNIGKEEKKNSGKLHNKRGKKALKMHLFGL